MAQSNRNTHRWTLQLSYWIGPVGRFSKKEKKIKYKWYDNRRRLSLCKITISYHEKNILTIKQHITCVWLPSILPMNSKPSINSCMWPLWYSFSIPLSGVWSCQLEICKVVYFMTQNTISNIFWDILALCLLLDFSDLPRF